MKRILYLHTPSTAAPLAEAFLSLSPKVSLCLTQNIYVEISNTTNWWGGENIILQKTQELLSAFQFEVPFVLTDRPEWAKAFEQSCNTILAPQQSYSALLSLPIDRLSYCGDPQTLDSELPERNQLIAFMRRVGLRAIKDFLHLPLSAISRRFGKTGILLQEWVSGTRHLSLPDFFPEAPIQATLDMEEIGEMDQLLFAIKQQLVRMEARLRGRHLAAKSLEMVFVFSNKLQKSYRIVFDQPTQESQTLFLSLRDRLNDIHWDSPPYQLELKTLETVSHQRGQLSLWDQSEQKFTQANQYVQRIKNRWGERTIGAPQLVPSYLPEHSWKKSWPPTEIPTTETHPHNLSHRPLLLFNEPRPFTPGLQWTLQPSEKLDTEWWNQTGQRQYYIASSRSGEKAWVYWDIKLRAFFTHGLL